MLEKVRSWVQEYKLLTPGCNVLAACSGGPDSLALVHLLHTLRSELDFNLAVAHVNHMFRPEAADEAAFVADFAKALKLKCFVTEVDVPAYSKKHKLSPEEAGRMLRYRYFREVAASLGGAFIATGHHRDDQVETVLINFLRGAGSSGLKGMRPITGDVIRPLLSVSRKEIEEYCRSEKLYPCYDMSNYTLDYLRNRVRLRLLPLLEEEYNPSMREALWRLSGLMFEQYDYISEQAGKLIDRVVTQDSGKVQIKSREFSSLHPAMQREVIRQAVFKKRGTLTGISFDHVEKLLNMALTGTVGSLLTLPGGMIIRRSYDGLELDVTLDELTNKAGLIAREVTVPGCTTLENGWKVVAKILRERPISNSKYTAVFDLDKLALPLTIRSRLPGDKFRPLGLNGSKKLKEFFIDAKVPEVERSSVPVVTDQKTIIWIAGYRQSESGKVSGQTQKFLQLIITK